MAHGSQDTVTRLLDELQRGNRDVLDRLFSVVYEELHGIAHRQRRQWHGDYTLNTTALLHEAYLKLVDQSQAEWESRSHFMAVAAKAMRHILVDYAKQRRAAKRGGDVQKVSLEAMPGGEEVIVLTEERADELIALEEALGRLERVSERQSRIVECRFFGGMTIEETAAALNISPATVKRGWAMAQAWLYREIQQELNA